MIFLFPLVWRPQKENFARRFERLSDACEGAIFTLSGQSHRHTAIGRFAFHSGRHAATAFGRFWIRLWVQSLLPLALFLGRRERGVDVVVAYDPYGSGINGVLLKHLLGARLIVEVNGDHHRFKPSENRLKDWIMGTVFRISVRNADAIKVLNRDQADYFREHHPGKQLYRFANFVADRYFESLERRDGSYLLSVGHPFEPKGVGELIRAFDRIKARHPAIGLRIMGHASPQELASYRALAGEDSRVEFLPAGWVEDVGEQMRCCTVLVNAAHFEAMGRVMLEAMACHKPVVATRTFGALDYVEDGATGLLCEIADPEDLAAKLDRLLSDRKLAERLGEAGHRRLAAEFAEGPHTEKTVSMLRAVCGGAA